MRYEGSIYRPPSEAYSLIIQATIGCSHNRCTFCSMYKDKKFRIRDIAEILKDIEEGKRYYGRVRKVFLADGDALAMKTEDLKLILERIREIVPECERVSTYSGPGGILRKTVRELIELKELGLGMVYMGLESGNDGILEKVKKGVTSLEMIEAGRRIKESGIKLSITVISGLGGKDKWKEHALDSAGVISNIDPQYLGLLTLMVEPGTEIEGQVGSGELKLLAPVEVMQETRLLIEKLNVTDCVFRSNHASNYYSLSGTLPQDKERLLMEIDKAMKCEYDYKDEYFRRL